ncbi:MAG TPA: methyltransferase type 11 [Verrucomicrobiales bacterium]|nr:methyltransferase type 11 [Verrucomicrobiales bacterium]
MKGRESGMPDEDYWASFYDAGCLVERLLTVIAPNADIAEFGSGYGTFTFPAAQKTIGRVYAIDIEPDLVERVRLRANDEQLTHIVPICRDFVEHGTGLPAAEIGHAMLYNILHIENPVALLREAFRILRPGGSVSVIHWRSDRATPRGPSLDIRPTPEQCEDWLSAAGFVSLQCVDISCCSHHYAVLAYKPDKAEVLVPGQ